MVFETRLHVMLSGDMNNDWRVNHEPEQEQLKQRDQSLRKQEQEMDSLSFRNQQLTKRVELLQEELAVSEAKGKKGKVIMRGDQGSCYTVCKRQQDMFFLKSYYKIGNLTIIAHDYKYEELRHHFLHPLFKSLSYTRIKETLPHSMFWRPRMFLMRTYRKR